MSAATLACPPPTTRPQRQSSYLPQLDGLRGIAILSVLLHHFQIHLSGWIDWGPVGVRIFFLLSGYLITLSLWKLHFRVADGANYWAGLRAFHARRMVRLTPVLYAMIALGCVMGLAEFQDALGWHLAFLTNFHTLISGEWPGAASHLWSLSVQEQFYLSWPLVILLIPRSYLPYALAAFILGAATFRFGCMATGASDYYRWTMLPGMLDSFALGALIACWKASKRQLPITSGKVGTAIGVAAFGCYVVARLMRNAPFSSPWLAFTESFENLFLGWVLLRTIEGWGGITGRIFENGVLIFLGKISYGLYVFHTLVHVALDPWLNRIGLTLPEYAWARAALLLPVSVAIATLSWRFVEQPLARWARRREAGSASATASTA